MGCGIRCLLVPGIVVVFLAYQMYVPVPDGFQQPTKFRLMCGTYQIFEKVFKFLEFLGFGNRWILARPMFEKMAKPTIDSNIKKTDTTFDGVKVRVYQPIGTTSGGPGIIFIHGGGWVVGSLDIIEVLLIDWIQKMNVVVVSVDYRLAPEHAFPVPFEDCVKASKYFLLHAGKYAVNPSRIAIAGDSAGGNLAAAVSLKLRDERFSPQPKLQVLIYPTLQGIDFSTPSMQQFEGGGLLTRATMASFVVNYITGSDELTPVFLQNMHTTKAVKASLASTYLNHDNIDKRYKGKTYVAPVLGNGDERIWKKVQGALLNPYCMPLMAQDLTNLPASLVYTVGQDVLRDDGIWYAQRLGEAGNDVTHKHMASATHGMVTFIGMFEESLIMSDTIIEFIKKKL